MGTARRESNTSATEGARKEGLENVNRTMVVDTSSSQAALGP